MANRYFKKVIVPQLGFADMVYEGYSYEFIAKWNKLSKDIQSEESPDEQYKLLQAYVEDTLDNKS